jgi:hypothetical protein
MSFIFDTATGSMTRNAVLLGWRRLQLMRELS